MARIGNFTNKIEASKDVVYTTYTLNEIYEGKYDIQVNIPFINVNHDNVINMDKEITSIFYNKVNNILADSKKENAQKTIYTVSYAAYLNENILSLVIKANLKEGNTPQRVIVKAYNYNLSTNEEEKLSDMLEIKGISIASAEDQIKKEVEEAISYTENLSSLGYNSSYKRNLNDEMYKIGNSDNYFLGPNGNLYVIYAYGNANFTTECDVVNVK